MSPPDVPPTPPDTAPTGGAGNPAWYARRIELVLYLVAGVTYVGFAMFHKFLLNWIIGPIWLVAWVTLVPALVDSIRRRPR